MAIQVPPDVEAMIRAQVESGRYGDAGEVVRDALALLDERNRLDRLRAEIAIGDEQIARGDVVTWTPDFMERLMREADERSRRGLPVRDVVKP